MSEEENGEKINEESAAVDGKEPADDAKELKDRMLRLAAEFDNYKKRAAKDMSGAADKGKAEVILKLLPVIDEFELAIGSMDMEQEHAKGVSLIYSNLISTLKSMGLRPVDAKGRYDPYRHEILLTEENDAEDGTIIETVRKGYMLNDIMLRPASVIISKHKSPADEKKAGGDKDEGDV